MSKILYTAVALLLMGSQTQAQTLRIKSKSLNVLDVVALGTDAEGKSISSRMMYNIYDGFNEHLNLYELKYGCNVYDKNDRHSGYDKNLNWSKIVVYNNSLVRYDTLDISSPKTAYLAHANVKVKVKQKVERNHLVTDVVLNDY